MNIFYWNKLLVAIEAMKYGKPVIASNRGALPEIIGNRVGGVFEFNNIIE
ncbi:MAG: glycosyltransferase [Clostridium sp.]|nr:glycosyltransferase [Clostridium sp.]